MNDKEANDRRCIAADIIVHLYEARQIRQLMILQMQVDASLEKLTQCTCGADRTGPTAEAHDKDCPAAISL